MYNMAELLQVRTPADLRRTASPRLREHANAARSGYTTATGLSVGSILILWVIRRPTVWIE